MSISKETLTYPPDPLPLFREGGVVSKRGGGHPLSKSLPLMERDKKEES